VLRCKKKHSIPPLDADPHKHTPTHTNTFSLVGPRLGVHLGGAAGEHEDGGPKESGRRADRRQPVRLAQQVGEAAGDLGALDGGLAGLRRGE